MSMTADELNRRLANALGWKHWDGHGDPMPIMGREHGLRAFNPARSVDDLRDYVLPEIERRGLWDEFVSELASPWLQNFSAMRWEAFVLTASPAVLAAAALKALEVKR